MWVMGFGVVLLVISYVAAENIFKHTDGHHGGQTASGSSTSQRNRINAGYSIFNPKTVSVR
jgi:hypothetical protein